VAGCCECGDEPAGYGTRELVNNKSNNPIILEPQGSRKRGMPRNSWQRSILTEAGKRELEGVETYCQRQEKMELVGNQCT
jgi:hypothetical protein